MDNRFNRLEWKRSFHCKCSGLVIGSANGYHFVSHVQDARAEGKEKTDSIIHTFSIVGKPIIITTLTSMMGFLALLVMDTVSGTALYFKVCAFLFF